MLALSIRTLFPKSAVMIAAAWLLVAPAYAVDNAAAIYVPINRSSLISLAAPTSEVLVANPDIADIHVHNSNNLTIIAKRFGHTNVRIMNKDGTLQRELDVTVGYDLPAIRKTLKSFLPDEKISVEMVNTSVALTGHVSNAAAADKALKITREYIYGNSRDGSGGGQEQGSAGTPGSTASASSSSSQPDILNFLQVTSGQQVILRVRIGEINRTALKSLGLDLSVGVADGFRFATGAGLAGLIQPATSPTNTAVTFGPGNFFFPTDSNNVPNNTRGAIIGSVSKRHNTLAGALQALEQDGLFKLLAEPNLVAMSGEQAEFLAGGEIPIPVPQSSGGGSGTSVTIEYKPYGVAVRFKPSVLDATRIHMEVQPEVSELDSANALQISGFSVPAITTRRAKTTVELAPGEGFMIAGLLKDQTSASVDQLPGMKELPILGALFRSTSFQRNETELVIAVTPYIVDPLKSSDVKMPTDDFRPASQMEMFFYGALGSLAGTTTAPTQQQALEGPTGFMMD